MGARVSSPRRCREEGVIEAKSGVYATSIAQGGPADGATGLALPQRLLALTFTH
ncbi:hypothetical protein E2C01_084144 [Portunus trituberculatus]|uniref:Uncharacterized protein n=1 Tax=Portunus trituberculatus TaxID=210409 RepID=A0A5B7J8F7_PORTR|nr:hypothetical protein [Portunus trituberculatus]